MMIRSRSDIQCLLYHQTAGLRHGLGHQPLHCRVARRSLVGHSQLHAGRDVSFHFADLSLGDTRVVEVNETVPEMVLLLRGQINRLP